MNMQHVQPLFTRENFIQAVRRHKQRKQEWEQKIMEKWEAAERDIALESAS